MDRITRSSTSSHKVQNTGEQQTIPTPAKKRGSQIAATAGLIANQIGNQVAMALQPPPALLGVPSRLQSPTPSEIENPQLPAAFSASIAMEENQAFDEMLQESSKSMAAGIEVENANLGGMHLKFPTAVTDDVLMNFVLVHCNPQALHHVTSVDLSFCKKLTQLSLLALSQGLPALTALNLTGCSQFNDDEIINVSEMVNLKNLTLAGCSGISKHGYIELARLLDNVEILDLTSCSEVDNEVLAALPSMHQLKHLVLTACTNFTEDSFAELGKLRKLQSLLIDQCPQITNASLGKLGNIAATKLKKLAYINVSNCPRLTPEGVFALKQTLPRVKDVISTC